MDYEFLAGNLALDFVNTVHNHGSEDPGDDLKAMPDLVAWAAQAGLLREGERRDLQSAEGFFQRSLALRELLYQIFSRVAKGKRPAPDMLQVFQKFYQESVRHQEFKVHPDGHYQLGWGANAHPSERVLREITCSAAELLTSEALGRVRQCSGETCTWLFVDTSRNGMRRWCDMKMCGNRAKVRRFRSRA